MSEGVVLVWNDHLGFGFIKTDTGNIFVHYTEIHAKGRKSLKEGDKVEFDVYESRHLANGKEARNVRKIN